MPKRHWEPVPGGGLWSWFGRTLSLPCYPTLLPFALFSHSEATVENARYWRRMFAALLFGGGGALHAAIYHKFVARNGMPLLSWSHIVPQVASRPCARSWGCVCLNLHARS